MGRTITSLFGAVLLACLAYGSKCPEQETTTRHVLCYYEGRTPLDSVNLCNCTHIVLTNAVKITKNYSLNFVEDAKEHLRLITDRKQSITKAFALTWRDDLDGNILESENKTRQLANEISNFVGSFGFNGVELNLPFSVEDTVSKGSVTSFIKTLKKTLENSPHIRVKREGYDVSENLQDDITTAAYRTPTTKRDADNKGSKKSGSKRRKNYRTSRRREEEEDEVTERKVERPEKRSRRMRKELRNNHGYEPTTTLLVRLPVYPEVIAKKFDLKALSKYADLIVVSTHHITDESEKSLTYHPSRLMGLSDMLNADSILDFLSGLGVTKSKVVLSIPAKILKFQLLNPKKTTPRSPRVGEPLAIDQSKLCSLFSKGNWTIERDDDLTAPYAFSDKTWIAYEDKLSVNIKAKYILLRELAGGAIYPIDADNGRDPCNDTSAEPGFLTSTLFKNIVNLDRKPRGLVLESLQQDIHDTSYSTVEAGVHLSEYRIVRVVDHSGAVHVIRKNTKTQFECSRQGYFSHPLGCNKFYRCVKFNQYTDDFTVFEYDCPAGLAFDERWEVCVWPGSLPHGAPCTGSSEIAPVPRSHYQCPNQEGYYADPENCRWFFACLDHARDGVTPLTAYEFRCPFGLVFNEQNLACDWPWNVGACGNRGFSGVVVEHYGGASSGLQSATFVNSGLGGSGFNAYESSGHSAHQGVATGFGSHHGSTSGFAGHEQIDSNFKAQQLGSIGLGVHQGGFASGFSSHQESGSAFGHSTHGESQRGSSFGGSYAGAGYIAGQFEEIGDRASFGSIPEHEISGGRIINKGGLILHHDIDFKNARGFSKSFQDTHINVATPTPILETVQTVKPAPVITRLKDIVYNPPLSSPRPFSVHVPEVQVNEEQYSSSYVGASTTPRVETYQNGKSGSFNSFTVSSVGSAGHAQDSAAYGERVTLGLAQDGLSVINTVKQLEIPVSTASPIAVQEVHAVSGGYDQSSHVSATTAGYSSSDVVSGGYSVSSTPAPFRHNYVEKGETVLVTPQPEVQNFEFQKTNFAASNGTVFAHSPIVQVSTPAPFTITSDAFGHKQSGYENGILLEEKVERVVIPKVYASPAPSLHGVSFNQETVSAKSVVADSGVKFAAVTPATFTVEKQEFIGPIHLSSPAPFSFRKGIGRQSLSTPAPALFRPAEYLTPAQRGVVKEKVNLFTPEVQTKFVQPVPTSAPAILKNSGFVSVEHGQVDSGISIVKPAVQYVSTPAPAVISVSQGHVDNSAVIQEQVKYVQPVVSTPAPAVFNVAVDGGRVDGSIAIKEQAKFIQPVVSSTPAPAVFNVAVDGGRVDGSIAIKEQAKFIQPVVSSTPAPAVFKGAEYLPPVQSSVVVQENVDLYKPAIQTKIVEQPSVTIQENVNLYKPVVQTKFVQPVSTPAPAVFKSEFVSGNFGGPITPVVKQAPAPAIVKEYIPPVVQNVQTQFIQPIVSTPVPAVFKKPSSFVSTRVDTIVKPAVQVSTPAPAVFKGPEYLPPVQSEVVVSSGLQQNFGEKTIVDTKFVQPVVSTPAPVAVTIDQGVKSNIQTFAQAPVFQDVKIVQSTPAPAAKFVPPVQSTVVLQENVNLFKPAVETKFVQPVSTPVTTVFKRPEFVSYEQKRVNTGNIVVKPAIQHVSTPAPALFNVAVNQEHINGGVEVQEHTKFAQPVQTEFVVSSGIQQNFGEKTIVGTKYVQPTVATPAPAVFKGPEYLPPVQGSVTVQENVYKPAVQTKIVEQPAVVVQDNVNVYKPVVQTKFVQPVSTPAPVVFKRPEFVAVEQVKPAVQYVSTPAPVFKQQTFVQQNRIDLKQPVEQVQFVSTPAPAVFKGEEYLPPIQQQVELKSNVQEQSQVFSQTPGPIVQEVKVAEPVVSTPAPIVVPVQQSYIQTSKTKQFIQTPVRQSYNFVPPSPSSFIFEDKQIPIQKQVFRGRAKAKQLYQTVQLQPQVSYQEEIYSSTPATIELKSPAPTPAQIFGYQSTPQTIDVTPKIIPLEQTTAKPFVYEEYVEVSSPKPEFIVKEERFQKPIVVADKQKSTIYYENFERVNPVVTALEKEVVQVSSESPLLVNNVEQTVDYYPPSGEEIYNYRNFEFQKIDNNRATGEVKYKVNSNIHIAPPPEEYILSVSPKVITSTVPPLSTTTVYRARARPTTTTSGYEYETRRGKSGKATIISVGNVDKEELEDDNVESLLEKYSGDFGNVLARDKFVTKVVHGEEQGEFAVGEGGSSTVGYDVSTSRSRSRLKSAFREEVGSEDATVASLDLKNLKLNKNKKTVIIVSQVSDANPLLIGKLAGQCSCQSNQIQVRRKKLRGQSTSTTTTTTYSPLHADEVTSENVLDSLAIEAVTPTTDNVILIDGSRSAGRVKAGRRRPAGRSRYEDNEIGQELFSPVPADEIASTGGYNKVGPAFDRYGPGGLRGFDETLQGSVDCERPGLFRHPKYCNKFYACNYDPWKKRYTLHVFNCPIHLSYDSSISACNWPSKGPACSDDHLLV